MQALFFLWSRGHLVRIDHLATLGGADLSKIARKAMMKTILDTGASIVDRCTIYLVKDCKLIFSGEEREEWAQ